MSDANSRAWIIIMLFGLSDKFLGDTLRLQALFGGVDTIVFFLSSYPS